MAAKTLTYFEMWNLVLENYNETICPDAEFRALLTQEDLMALFWEETQFSNRRQVGFDHDDWLKRWTSGARSSGLIAAGNHAVGFGQVEREGFILMKGTRSRALRGLVPGVAPGDLKVHELDLLVLGDNAVGAQVGWRAMWHVYLASPSIRSTRALLNVHGGQVNRDKVPGLLNCGRILRAFQKMPRDGLEGERSFLVNMELMAGAFWLARHNGDFEKAFGIDIGVASEVGRQLKRLSNEQNLVEQLHRFVAERLNHYH